MGQIKESQDRIVLDEQSRQAILSLLYFEIFSYPMTLSEICECTALPGISISATRKELDILVKKGILFHIDGYYLTQNNPSWVARREDGNRRAKKYVNAAFLVAKLMSAFPYVRAVFVSGSLSKQWMSKESDIDYFIITRPGRLWLARTMLALFKKTFLLNSHKYFCINYFVDEDHLEIEEKNQYTATEIVTLLPVYGQQYYDRFMAANQWTKAYYPNYPVRPLDRTPRHHKGVLQNFSETVLNTRLGEWLDNYCMRKTMQFWQQKFDDFDPAILEVALKSRKYVSKHHPSFYQGKVLKAYEEHIRAFEERNNLELGRR